MNHLQLNPSALSILKQRRDKLAKLCKYPVILWSGSPPPRNFAANRYPFRANSHFLYFAGLPLVNAAIHLENGELRLFMDAPHPNNALWHGETSSPQELGDKIGATVVSPLKYLKNYTQDGATLPVMDFLTYQKQSHLLNRSIGQKEQDLALKKAIITLRLTQDDFAQQEIRQAVEVSVKAHVAGIQGTKKAKTEAEVRGIMESVIIGQNMTCAYNSIVTVEGQVLHNEAYHNPLKEGDLVLADVGAESQLGYASDITRTWPVSGKFSPTQRDIYDMVLAAHDACIAKVRAGVEYEEIHLVGCGIIAHGLKELGIFKGAFAEDLLEIDAHALFFPHGIGHLLGLDVHDMEDLGDLAGYQAGRERSKRFGLGYLRLNRPLRSGMIVTIEPGFYQVPAILHNPEFQRNYGKLINWERLAQFADVKGIRIEDDILVTDNGAEVLTKQLPTSAETLESLMA
ncbi:MAG: aminopeptidase P N-terminal domain-containing protein [Microcystaceae cyanobacterium]